MGRKERMVKRYRRQPFRRWRNTAAQARQIGAHGVQSHVEWKHSAGVGRCNERANRRIAEMNGCMQEISDRHSPAAASKLMEVLECACIAEQEIAGGAIVAVLSHGSPCTGACSLLHSGAQRVSSS